MMFSVAHGRSLRRASFINGVSHLRAAQQGYTDFSNSMFRVWMSTNVFSIGGTQYQCFVQVAGGWGWEGGTLAMTTNQTLIWTDVQRRAKIVTLGRRPPLFGGP